MKNIFQNLFGALRRGEAPGAQQETSAPEKAAGEEDKEKAEAPAEPEEPSGPPAGPAAIPDLENRPTVPGENTTAPPEEERAARVERYRILRDALARTQTTVANALPREVVFHAAHELGRLENGRIVLGHEYHMDVIIDFSLYSLFDNGLNPVQKFAAQNPPTQGSLDQTVLQAMGRSHYSIFRVEERVPGVGVHMLDLVTLNPLFLYDLSLSGVAERGAGLAGRIVALEGITMSTGALLPLASADTVDAARNSFGWLLDKWGTSPPVLLTKDQQAELATAITTICLLDDSMAPRTREVRPPSTAAPRGGSAKKGGKKKKR